LAKSKKGGGGGGGGGNDKKGGGGGGDGGDFNWKEYRKGVSEKMQTSIDAIQSQMNTLRASGANPSMLDRIFVEYFGSLTPLNQVASVGTNGPNQLTIDPFDKTILGEIEKAISMSDLNLNPQNDGTGLIRITVPQLTEERRKELVKQAKTIAEDGKVAIRNHRRDAVDKVKELEKKSSISKDDSKGFQDDLQSLTDECGKKMDAMYKAKEAAMLKV
jgi:ribosome recycling factor